MQKKKGKYDDYQKAPEDTVLFLFDVETSGSKRNYDCIVAFSFLAYDVKGRLLGNFAQKVKPGRVRMSAKAMEIHGKVFEHNCVKLVCVVTLNPTHSFHRVNARDVRPDASFSSSC